ncbi:TPA: hypothetical protein ACIAKG_002873 [Enterobacter roggenkampii]
MGFLLVCKLCTFPLRLIQTFKRPAGVVNFAGGLLYAIAQTVERAGLTVQIFNAGLRFFEGFRQTARTLAGGIDRAGKFIDRAERDADIKAFHCHWLHFG